MLVIHFIALMLFAPLGFSEGTCTKKTDCSCTMDDGKVVDISSLKKLTVNDATNKNDYLFQPCQNFNIGLLTSVTLAQHAQTTDVWFEVGSDPNVQFQTPTGANNVQLQIKSKAGDRTGNILLMCSAQSTTPSFTFVGEFPSKTYNFQLMSKQCCPASPAPPTTHKPSGGGSSSGNTGLSIGSIIVIVFFVILILYAVMGILYKVKVKQAEGTKRIPNVIFWSALPGLIKDGFKFTISCGSRNRTYASI